MEEKGVLRYSQLIAVKHLTVNETLWKRINGINDGISMSQTPPAPLRLLVNDAYCKACRS